MLKEQKELLAQIGKAHAAALKLYNAGVKISGIVQKLRAAGDELETRIRYIEKVEKSAPGAAPKPPAPPAKKSATENPKS
ncbi:MAG: hypothetical protein HC901_00330 [Bdellovibrionaceae bacterium]|nr:hypothetical protein [Pseudobdellovibrionaceae bacterium]